MQSQLYDDKQREQQCSKLLHTSPTTNTHSQNHIGRLDQASMQGGRGQWPPRRRKLCLGALPSLNPVHRTALDMCFHQLSNILTARRGSPRDDAHRVNIFNGGMYHCQLVNIPRCNLNLQSKNAYIFMHDCQSVKIQLYSESRIDVEGVDSSQSN